MLRIIKTLILCTLLLMSACGYHLRGSHGLPEAYKSVYFQGASSHLKKSVRRALRSSDGFLVSNAGESDIVIQIVKEEMDKRSLSLSPTGRATEYELAYKLHYSLYDTAGKKIAEPQKIEIIKNYFNDQEDILAKNKEEQVIRNEIYQKAAQTIFNRARVTLN